MAALNFHENRSQAFESEVKNLIYIEIPKIKPVVAEYLAKRIDIMRLRYEADMLKHLNQSLGRKN